MNLKLILKFPFQIDFNKEFKDENLRKSRISELEELKSIQIKEG